MSHVEHEDCEYHDHEQAEAVMWRDTRVEPKFGPLTEDQKEIEHIMSCRRADCKRCDE